MKAKGLSRLVVAVLLILLAPFAKAEDLCSKPVMIESGQVIGINDSRSRTCAWLGIPFAAAPVGQLRWAAPQPAQKWSGVRAADKWGNYCMQSRTFLSTEDYDKTDVMSEDCLYLNVWRPKKVGKFPVMLWIHGGGYTTGSGKYPGGKISEFGDVVVVSINYRLNIFGFYAAPKLREEDPHKSVGGYGSLDQVAALNWVHNNIAGFGGDPESVTVFGQSAGGWSICTMLATPLAKGLFSKAILESGGCEASESVEQGFQRGAKLAAKFGCQPDDLACMRNVPAEKLAKSGMGDMLKEGFSYVPHHDGYLLTDSPLSMIRSGNFNKVPLLAGSAKEEVNAIIVARVGLYNAPPSQYEKKLEQYLYLSPDEAKKAAQLYPLSSYHNKPGKAAGYMLTDLAFGCPTFLCLDEFAKNPLPTYYYRFDYRGNRAGRYIGAMHAMELPLVFGAFDLGNMSLLYRGKIRKKRKNFRA